MKVLKQHIRSFGESNPNLIWLMWGISVALGWAVLSAKVHWLLSYVVSGTVIGLPFVIQSARSPKFGVYLMIFMSLTLNVYRMIVPSVPFGVLMDFLVLIMTLSCWLDDLNKRAFTFFKSPLTTFIIIWVGWHILELMNPEAASRVAWFYVMRPVLGYIMLFFITFRYFTTQKDIIRLILFIWWICFISGAWGLYQYIVGYFPFEMNYLIENDMIHLFYIQGRWRCFGTMGSPAQFGVAMAFTSTLSFLLLWVNGISKAMKAMIVVGAVVMFAGLIYSGTRTAIAYLPVGMAVIVILAKDVRLYIASVIGGILFAIMMSIPTQNYHLKRIQSTFKTEEDASYKVREENRKIIRPYILSHPMGGGLGSTGVWGARFSPNTFLAKFPPDSGYMRVAVEMGWVGLIIYILLWVAIVWYILTKYYKIKNKKWKWLSMSIISSTLPLAVVEYTQDIIGKLPFSLLFWVLIAIAVNSAKAGVQKE